MRLIRSGDQFLIARYQFCSSGFVQLIEEQPPVEEPAHDEEEGDEPEEEEVEAEQHPFARTNTAVWPRSGMKTPRRLSLFGPLIQRGRLACATA